MTATTIEVVVATVGCANLHLTEVLYISPVLYPDGTVEGMLGSSADFCDVCDASANVMGVCLDVRPIKDRQVRIHEVRRA